ncbi:MAG: alcohol dehydrogenase catalytic domain-containing protein, partial [Nitrospirota bacterium]|nr:alcohol dehydrogenase catalytic domain-containing protein [Nitrospirota bacterium]
MKAAILVEQKKPLVIADIEAPAELQYGQALVRIVCSGICGSQIGEIDGVKGPDKFLPHLLGHEGGG